MSNLTDARFFELYTKNVEELLNKQENETELKTLEEKTKSITDQMNELRKPCEELRAKRKKIEEELQDEITQMETTYINNPERVRLQKLKDETLSSIHKLKAKTITENKYFKDSKTVYRRLFDIRKQIEELKESKPHGIEIVNFVRDQLSDKRYYRNANGTRAGCFVFGKNELYPRVPELYFDKDTKTIDFTQVFLKISVEYISEEEMFRELNNALDEFFTF